MSKPILDWPGIVAEIKRRGFSLSELARLHGYHPSSFVQVKTKCHFYAQGVIAACIEKDERDLWPDRYFTKPRIVSSRLKATLESKKSNAHSDMEKAA